MKSAFIKQGGQSWNTTSALDRLFVFLPRIDLIYYIAELRKPRVLSLSRVNATALTLRSFRRVRVRQQRAHNQPLSCQILAASLSGSTRPLLTQLKKQGLNGTLKLCKLWLTRSSGPDCSRISRKICTFLMRRSSLDLSKRS